jgi:hypothetical protein
MQRIPDIDANSILNATPSDLKSTGLAKLPNLIITLGNQILTIINPSLETLISKYNITSGDCLTEAQFNELINQRNNIVDQLNRISKTLNVVTITLTGASTFLNLLQSAINGIEVAKIAAKIAALAFPALAATLPTTLNTLNSAKTQLLLDNKGNSRLTKISNIVGGAALAASIVGGYILKAITLLKSIDLFLQKCDPNLSSLTPISKETQDIADAQLQAETTQNQTTYNGFIIEIEEIPYAPGVVRRRAVGKNQQGIVLIQTELSFTTDNQTLINELKLIIDRDNLKAY